MLENAKTFMGGTVELVKGNPGSTAVIGITSILGWELGGRKLALWTKNKVSNSAAMSAAKQHAASLGSKKEVIHPTNVAEENAKIVSGEPTNPDLNSQVIHPTNVAEENAKIVSGEPTNPDLNSQVMALLAEINELKEQVKEKIEDKADKK